MSKGIFYSVGLGPGDPSLMTFKAAETIRACDVVMLPDSGGKENLAREIAGEHIKGKRVEFCPMPMTREQKALDESHDLAASQIKALLEQGLCVAFLTLGDPSIYSTAMYVHKRLAAMGFETRMIPGVPSFCAAAAALNTALCEGGQPVHIIPAAYGGDYLELDGTKVLMKPGKEIGSVIDALKQRGDNQASMVRRASMEDERVFQTLEEIDGGRDYFSILVVKQIDQEAAGCKDSKEYFPLFISSKGKKALIAGGGKIALRRAQTLLQFAFDLTVVAPEVLPEFERLHEAGRLRLCRREFQDADLDGCLIAVAATDQREVNRRLGEQAKKRGIFASVADRFDECGFLFPAIAVSGDIIVGLTSGGKSHRAVAEAARKVREAL